MAAVVARMSARLIISLHTVPAGALPGQRTMNGTLNPPSHTWCLPPRSGPFTAQPGIERLVCGESARCGSFTPPLSLEKITSVFLRDAHFVERVEHAAHAAVELVNPVAVKSRRALARDVLVGRHGIVHRDRREVEEERLVLRLLLHPVSRLVREHLHHALVLPARGVEIENRRVALAVLHVLAGRRWP